MSSPYDLNILDNCMTCPVQEEHPFCNLSPSAVHRLNDITPAAVYPRAASRLFADFKMKGFIQTKASGRGGHQQVCGGRDGTGVNRLEGSAGAGFRIASSVPESIPNWRC
jgi:hypothetical protein